LIFFEMTILGPTAEVPTPYCRHSAKQIICQVDQCPAADSAGNENRAICSGKAYCHGIPPIGRMLARNTAAVTPLYSLSLSAGVVTGGECLCTAIAAAARPLRRPMRIG